MDKQQKEAPLGKPKLLFLPRNTQGVGFYRMLAPASKLKDMGLAEVEIDNKWDDERVKRADVVIIQIPSEAEGLTHFARAQANGTRVVVEVDDLLWGINPSNYAWDFWNPMGENLGIAIELMRRADAITTTAKRIANEYVMLNKNVHVLPNYLDGDLWDRPRSWTKETEKRFKEKKKDDTIRIGFTGSYSHKDDIEMIAPIILKVIKDFENVQFIFMGFDPLNFFAKMSLEAFGAYTDREPPIKWVRGTNILEYPDKLMFQAFDIGLAPLVERGFNECKSDLKLKEYAALGIPTVASQIQPYSPSLKEGETGLFATTGKDWYEAIKKLIEDKKTREKMGKNARKWHEENKLSDHINEWVEAYQKIRTRIYSW